MTGLKPLPYTAEQLVAVARGHVGYREGLRNRNRYGLELGMDHVPWCALFVESVSRQAGGSLVEHLGIAWSHRGWTPSWLQAGKVAGRLVAPHLVIPGDVVLFDFPDRINRPQHVGIASSTATKGATFSSIEGNTSSGDAGSQDNGDGVHERRRSLSVVVGVVRPLYATQSGVPAAEPVRHHAPASRPPATATAREGIAVQLIDLRHVTRSSGTWVRGAGVEPMQRLIATPADGVAGPATAARLEAVQRRAGVAADRVFGPATASALLAGR